MNTEFSGKNKKIKNYFKMLLLTIKGKGHISKTDHVKLKESVPILKGDHSHRKMIHFSGTSFLFNGATIK